MAVPLNQDLVDRLVCAKYTFRRSCELLDRGGPFSAGLSVSGFQDAAELVLRTVVEHLHVPLKDNAAFNQIIDSIDESSPTKVSHRAGLNQLNKARTNFKHFGLEPREQDARKFRRDLEDFFPVALKQFLGVNFEEISLIALVGHRRTENHLRAAERHVEYEDYNAAIEACAVALALYREYLKRDDFERLNLDPFGRYRGSELKPLLDALFRVLTEHQQQLDILMSGINPVDFRRFESLAPRVTFRASNKTGPTGRESIAQG
jgi:hypothetical protein